MAKKKLVPSPETETDFNPGGKSVVRGADDKSRKRVEHLRSVFLTYQTGKSLHDARIIENDKWYRSLHWPIIKGQSSKPDNPAEPEPTSAYLWNTIANRHGDMMDAYPEPIFVEREKSDEPEASMLSKVVKVILERQDFHSTYSRNAWYKVKAGTSCYGVFWDQRAENGVGDITVKKVDILRLFWEPGVEDIDESKYVFSVSLVDVDKVRKLYPDLAEYITEDKATKYTTYSDTDTVDLTGKTLVIDAYELEYEQDAHSLLHIEKFCSGVMLDDTRWHDEPDEKGYSPAKQGLYLHGRYPFVFDTMFPEEHSILGFGLVDVIKSPQMYIDKLDQILIKNALIAGKYRVIVKATGGIREEDVTDVSKDVIVSDGGVKEGEDYGVLQAEALPQSVMAHRMQKILELKEVSGSNDFNRGNSGGGITAASAIMALQEAGNKLSRAMVTGTYAAYSRIVYLIMELIAQYYDEPRKFRITNEEGEPEYHEYTNAGLQPQPIVTGDPAVDSMPEKQTRKPILDITVHAEKHSPYAALAQNQTAKELFAAGMFAPEMAPAATIAMRMMTFDGKEKVEQMIQQNYQQMMTAQQGQQAGVAEMNANNDLLVQMNELIIKLTGQDMLAGADFGGGIVGQDQAQAGQAAPVQQAPGGMQS